MGDRQQDTVNPPASALRSPYLCEEREENKHRNVGLVYRAVGLSLSTQALQTLVQVDGST